MRRNDRETEIRMMTMEEYLKKRQAIGGAATWVKMNAMKKPQQP